MLKAGDHFGENALLRNEPRQATIMAESELSLVMITRDKFKEVGLNEKLYFKSRRVVGVGQEIKASEIKPPIYKIK